MPALFSDQSIGGAQLGAARCLLLKEQHPELQYPHTGKGRQHTLKATNGLGLLKLNLLSAPLKAHPSQQQYRCFAVLDKCLQKHYRIIIFHLPTFSAEDEVVSDIFHLLSSAY